MATLVTLSERRGVDKGHENALLQRCRAGDAGAYAELLCLYRGKAVNLAYGILGNPADAEDAAQEAFIRVFKNLRNFRGEAAFFSWLYRIVVNVSIEMLRRPSRREVPCGTQLHTRTDAETEETECGVNVRSVLTALPVHLRAILVLREADELSYAEIAGILDIPVGTVRSRLSAAREAFRRKYREMVG